MKKRILSLVLCAAMLLSMCLFMGAGVTADTDAADGSAESTETVVSTSSAPEFQGVGPFMTYFPGSSTVRKAPMLRAAAKDTSDGASNAVDVTKTATATDKKDADGKPIYQIDLTAAAKSNIVTHTKACDIVLVLDRSGSMNFHMDRDHGNLFESDTSKERVKALVASVNAFLTTIQESSPDSRVAIVSYAGDATIDSDLVSVTDPSDSKNVNPVLTTAVNGLENRCNGGTQSGKGLQQAVNIFNSVEKSDPNYDNTRVTVLFTDGKPGDSDWSGTDEGYDVAQQSVHWSTILKHAKGDTFNLQANVEGQDFYGQRFPWYSPKYGVSNYSDFQKGSANKDDWNWTGCGSTVYCVGLGLKASGGKDSEGCKINEYMYRVSSHRPDGSHVDNNRVNEWELETDSWEGLYTDARTRNHENGYYLTTDNAAELQRIFTQIAQQTGEAVKDVTIRDEISESFVPCDAAGNAYTVGDTITSNGKTGTVRQEANGNYYIEWTKVTLTPEQVDSNKVVTKPAETFQSTLYVKPRDGFLGGNNVPTNGTGSGVYTDGGEQIKLFPQPEVNVPVDCDAFAGQVKNIYYGNAAPTLPELSTATPLEPWQTRYVTITRTSNTDVSNTTDGTYTVTVTVTPDVAKETSAGTPATEKTASVTSTVNVYKPEITFKDSIIDYNTTPNYATDNLGGVVWKHEGTAADPANMTGEEPALAYSYDPEASAFTQDTGVKVTVSANGETLPADVVTFQHDPCTFPGCKYTDGCDYQFYVHIKVFDLTIVKAAADDSKPIDEDQTFVFHVKGKNNNVDMQVVITGANKQVIKNLPVGEYTITEDTSWSWKYTPVDNNRSVMEENIQDGTATVTFKNENEGTNWLTSLAKALNVWKDNGQAVERDPKN